ncbi:hypothetical protein CANCADRAFT_42323 [Tortispora caseinolytica NRRL Y-17796]|uniref:Uncharacterized protein n=1 Tax=Tortispora caseinolytica NRRL Y-17796 TaxID=767744 RepID=A0A1E4TIV6_9ASCO|nr:hypothetical protein CANCADRAFT_42323 [Tortispora caseinolytica NRRL Y-17796]
MALFFPNKNPQSKPPRRRKHGTTRLAVADNFRHSKPILGTTEPVITNEPNDVQDGVDQESVAAAEDQPVPTAVERPPDSKVTENDVPTTIPRTKPVFAEETTLQIHTKNAGLITPHPPIPATTVPTGASEEKQNAPVYIEQEAPSVTADISVMSLIVASVSAVSDSAFDSQTSSLSNTLTIIGASIGSFAGGVALGSLLAAFMLSRRQKLKLDEDLDEEFNSGDERNKGSPASKANPTKNANVSADLLPPINEVSSLGATDWDKFSEMAESETFDTSSESISADINWTTVTAGQNGEREGSSETIAVSESDKKPDERLRSVSASDAQMTVHDDGIAASLTQSKQAVDSTREESRQDSWPKRVLIVAPGETDPCRPGAMHLQDEDMKPRSPQYQRRLNGSTIPYPGKPDLNMTRIPMNSARGGRPYTRGGMSPQGRPVTAAGRPATGQPNYPNMYPMRSQVMSTQSGPQQSQLYRPPGPREPPRRAVYPVSPGGPGDVHATT